MRSIKISFILFKELKYLLIFLKKISLIKAT